MGIERFRDVGTHLSDARLAPANVSSKDKKYGAQSAS